MACKAVMYHYVRPTDYDQPNLYYLNVEDFKKQLDYFEDEYGIITQRQWETALKDSTKLPDGIILTFDDGLKDHYTNVYPILRERNYWGIFYPSTDSITKSKLLHVHRIHYLLGKYGGEKVFKTLNKLLTKDMFFPGFYENLSSTPYSHQTMDEQAIRVKKIVNYALKPESKNYVLQLLLEKFVEDEAKIAQEYYMTAEHIHEMHNAGFSFGAHGTTHNLLTKFQDSNLENEVRHSIEYLNSILPTPSKTFCFPYGGPDSYNDQLLNELKKNSIKYSFCVKSKDITRQDLLKTPLTLPRYDCNEFPHGKSRNK